jgi:hypothetical protein
MRELIGPEFIFPFSASQALLVWAARFSSVHRTLVTLVLCCPLVVFRLATLMEEFGLRYLRAGTTPSLFSFTEPKPEATLGKYLNK